jgi:hypothetical protein
MFEWNKFWKVHPRQWWVKKKPRLLGDLKGFGRTLLKARPKKDSGSGDPQTFSGFFPNVVYTISVLVCWKFADWVFTTHWLFSLLIALVLVQFCAHFLNRFRQN